MPIEKLYAHLSCTDLKRSTEWFSRLFGRPPDSNPMKGLVEWHFHKTAGLQLFKDAANAGHGTLTLIVEQLTEEHTRLERCNLAPQKIEHGDVVSIFRLRDPDDNLVVLAQPGR